jgi:hypothetical protein
LRAMPDDSVPSESATTPEAGSRSLRKGTWSSHERRRGHRQEGGAGHPSQSCAGPCSIANPLGQGLYARTPATRRRCSFLPRHQARRKTPGSRSRRPTIRN